ncbi:hypothetical protein AAZX31_13G084000 [Glycine max]|uniref:Proline-rich protein PRCC n=1 Tax=Glycine max TaxID=3847 RepID=I1LVL6_SOYBN|nr:proline-rich protein PRCC [Glycine max]KAG5112577.1 hypothetical protein JHK82_035846 [Glycine max]KAH1100713.1 hypothetical protein GYH30_035719 [Glycine max]KAH1216256.1 hypothetical protein GmHk_13G037198 [Glycine max]KRH19108.1 hypothetical protein GLYMA_13G101000v4 [Glycine max]|eukprot:XP_003542837.1 proline-rich protein PRCC [Glycine max]
MDSLLANYASSDEEEDQQPSPPKTTTFSSLPQPKLSLFQSLPQPKSSLFQSLPPPKQPSTESSSLPNPNPNPDPKPQIEKTQPKRVVQFRPPIIPLPHPSQHDDDDDDDDDDEEEERNRRKKKLESSTQTSSVKSFLASIPAPRNTATLGVQASSGSGRKSILETETPPPASNSGGFSNVPVDQSTGDYENFDDYQYATDQYASYYGNFGSGAEPGSSGTEPKAGVAAYGTEQYGNYGDAYASYGDYGQYGNNWGDVSAPPVLEASGIDVSVVRIPGKRGRHEIPTEVIEVKQEELIKNRPREDQVKLTGIAFGPTYQPASTKGKPTKLHKRKHQIGSLYFDMKQNEMKLAERRVKGMLTKAETQAKYGW